MQVIDHPPTAPQPPLRRQVRVYEFSERASSGPIVHFESVGGAAANESTPVAQPAGFQLRAQLRVHSADVTALSFNPAFKSLAVADRSGIVSLLDLSKPALMWLQVTGHRPWVASQCVRRNASRRCRQNRAIAARWRRRHITA